MQQRNRLQEKKTVQHASQQCLQGISRRVLEELSGKEQSITSILEALHKHSESFQNDLLLQEIGHRNGSVSTVILSKEEASHMAIDLGENVHQKSHFPRNVSLDILKRDVGKIYQIWDLLSPNDHKANVATSEESIRQRDMFIKLHGMHVLANRI